MNDSQTLRLAIGLVDRLTRGVRARELADHVGADAIYALIDDPELHVLVPAPGFPQTLPGGRAWRPLLEACRPPGLHDAHISAGGDRSQRVLACSTGDAVLVFLGDHTDEPRVLVVSSIMPAVAAALRAEHEITIATGALAAAQQGARDSDTLARALDQARAELEVKARSLDEARARAEEAVRAKDTFLAMLGHELRNPLAPIVTALHLMRMRGLESREQEIIERQVTHMRRLVDDLLDVARITQGKIELRRERVELAPLVARAIEMVRPLVEQRRQAIGVHMDSIGLAIDADPGRIAQVLSNLLTNAARYSPPDTTITIRAERRDDRVLVHVIDEGVGIDPAMLDSIFQPFVQDRRVPHDSERGLGLGLAIVQSLLTLHGGTVRAMSAGRNQGTEMIVDLPASSIDSPILASRSGPVAPDPVGRGIRVLVVDDNHDGAELLSQALRALGFDARTAPDGPRAIELAREFQPALVLLDIGLPVMDGYQVASHLLSESGAPRLVAITGYGQESDRARSRAAGFDAHLVKPVDLDELKAVLTDLVRSPIADVS